MKNTGFMEIYLYFDILRLFQLSKDRRIMNPKIFKVTTLICYLISRNNWNNLSFRYESEKNIFMNVFGSQNLFKATFSRNILIFFPLSSFFYYCGLSFILVKQSYSRQNVPILSILWFAEKFSTSARHRRDSKYIHRIRVFFLYSNYFIIECRWLVHLCKHVILWIKKIFSWIPTLHKKCK